MRLTLTHHPDGIAASGSAIRVSYDIEGDSASFGDATIEGPALSWVLHDGGEAADALMSAEVELDRDTKWIIRCDRIDFPPGGIAYRHTHPGPGIRCQLVGALTVETKGHTGTYGPLEAWFETGPDPVYAVASADESSAFIRVMVLPREWEGRRTIRYVDPADADKPKLQRATVYFDEAIEL